MLKKLHHKPGALWTREELDAIRMLEELESGEETQTGRINHTYRQHTPEGYYHQRNTG